MTAKSATTVAPYECYLFDVPGNRVINDTVYLISGVINAVMILVDYVMVRVIVRRSMGITLSRPSVRE